MEPIISCLNNHANIAYMTANINPLFITFEGCDGTGKSTQAKILANSMDALLTSDPKGTNYGKLVTDAAISEADGWALAFAFMSARAALVDNVIKPALQAGESVICDRFIDSTLVYQGVLGGLDMQALESMSTSYASAGIIPDLTIVLAYENLDDIHARIVSRAADSGVDMDRFDAMPVDMMRLVQDGFIRIASNNPSNHAIIQCDGKSVDDIHMDIIQSVREYIDNKKELM